MKKGEIEIYKTSTLKKKQNNSVFTKNMNWAKQFRMNIT